jgi:hypothetical protein
VLKVEWSLAIDVFYNTESLTIEEAEKSSFANDDFCVSGCFTVLFPLASF